MIDRVAPYTLVKPYRCTEADFEKYLPEGAAPENYQLQAEPANFTVRDSLELAGWLIRTGAEPAYGTVVMVHGIASCKEPLLGAARFFSQEGFNTLLFDLPAHGQSGGTYTTYGYYEASDISTYLDSCLNAFEQIEPLAILGNSMGAAISLQVLAKDKRVRCGVIESCFDDFHDVAEDYTRDKVKLFAGWISRRAIDKAEGIAEFEADSLNMSKFATRIHQPVLVVHGEDDDKISIKYGESVFQSLASEQKEWYPIPEAGHDHLWKSGGKPYEEKLVGFVRRWISE